MKDWNYDINVFHKRIRVFLYETPWYIDIPLVVLAAICDFLHAMPRIHLPEIPIKVNEEGKIIHTTLRKEWGSVQEWFCQNIHLRFFRYWIDRSVIKKIDLDYETGKKVFFDYDKRGWFDELKGGIELMTDTDDEFEEVVKRCFVNGKPVLERFEKELDVLIERDRQEQKREEERLKE